MGKTSPEFKIVPLPISIIIHDNNGEELGRFTEKDGILTFEGKVDEAGKRFVDYVCETFNSRIKELIKNK